MAILVVLDRESPKLGVARMNIPVNLVSQDP